MLKIGKVCLPGNLVLSPMAGVTDAPFRKIARDNGADYTISEMITSQLELWQTNKTKQRLKDDFLMPENLKIMQIMGATPEVVAKAAIACEQAGSDILEINMGCPAKKVCNVLAGSALLKDEILVTNILKAACIAVSIPVILKTRLGFAREQKNILTIARIAEDVGIQALTIHGRTREDLYNGVASYDLIAKVKQEVQIPVFANGDIDTPEKAKAVLEYTKANGLYIGRGALGKPWLFKQIKQYLNDGTFHEVDTRTIQQLIVQHLNYIYQHYDEYMGVRIARKHVKWYWQNLDEEFLCRYFAHFSSLASSSAQLDYLASFAH